MNAIGIKESGPAKPIEKRRHDSGLTRQKLLRAAEQCFIDKGFDAARVDEIALLAGMNKRLIYMYFGNKEELYREVVKINLKTLLDAGRNVSRQSANPIERARAAMERYFDFLAKHPGFVRLLSWESLMFKSRDDRELVALLEAGLSEMVEIIEQGVRQGVFRPDINAKQLVLSVSGLCLTYFQKRLLMEALWNKDLNKSAVRREVLDHIIGLVLDGVVNRAKA